MNAALKNLIRPHYLALQGYVSAGMESEKNAEKIFLNANENPYELPGLESYNRYPEPQPEALAQAYAKTYGVQPEHIAMTRGADEAIVILTKLFCEPSKDAVLICPPTFGMYSVDARAMPAGVIEVPLRKAGGTFTLDKKAIIKSVFTPGNNIKLIYICSPNNPTGSSFAHSDIAEIARETEDEAVVIVDETYAEFAKSGSMSDALSDHPNLIILRTLSKSYSMAGMRMGCFISADSDFIDLVKEKALDAYPLPRASIEASLHVLSDELRAQAHDNISCLIKERNRLIPLLDESEHIKYIYPSDANFLFIEMERAEGFIKFAAENNVIIRDFSSKPLTENCIRLSIGTPEQNDLVIKLLNDFEQQA